MNILITGGAGYMGSVAARYLLDEGHEVTVLDSLLHGGHAVRGLYTYDNFRFIRGDIRSSEDVDRALESAEAVVHLAAIVGDPACARDPELSRRVNQEAALQVFQACQRKGVKRFIFASTCSNYGKMEDPSELATEESNLQPVSLYAETKVAVERALLDSQSPGSPSVTVLRFATLFGMSPRMRLDLTVNQFTVDLATKQKLEVFGQQFWRPYVHVRDAARAIAQVLGADESAVDNQVFNVGDNDENYQKGQLVELIREEIGTPVEITLVPRDEDPRDYRVSFGKIQERLGYQITRTVRDGIREVLNAHEHGVISELDDPSYRN